MAIKRFNQTATNSWTNFVSWLNANKTGTFLENSEITNTGGSSIDTLTITSGDISISILLWNSGSSSTTVLLTYTDSSETAWTMNGSTYSSGHCYLKGAMLCGKGLIFELEYTTSGSISGQTSQPIALTVDNNGDIAVICGSISAATTNINFYTYNTYADGSTIAYTFTASPYYGANRTALAPVAVQSTDPEQYLQYAFAAISTTVSGSGLNSVVIDGNDYITNGVWYIKDA